MLTEWICLDPQSGTYAWGGSLYSREQLFRHFKVRWATADEIVDMIDYAYKQMHGSKMTRLQMYDYWEAYSKRGELPAMVFEVYEKENRSAIAAE